MKNLKTDFNWNRDADMVEKTPYYRGDVFTKTAPDDFFMTRKKEIFKFKYGFNSKPYVEFIKYDKNIKLPTGDNYFEYDKNNWVELPGTVELYKLKNFKNLYVWNY